MAGLIYNPATDELFTAERGKGAFLNDRAPPRRGQDRAADAVIGTGIPHRGRADHDLFLQRARRGHGRRRRGCAASAPRRSTSPGSPPAGFDGFWERNLRPWDIAAGHCHIARGRRHVTDADGKERMLDNGSVVTGNETIQRNLLKLLKSLPVGPKSKSAASSES